MRPPSPATSTPMVSTDHGHDATGKNILRPASSILFLGLLIAVSAHSQEEARLPPATSAETLPIPVESALQIQATSAMPSHCVPLPATNPVQASADAGDPASVRAGSEDGANSTSPRSGGLLVFVDPETGELQPQPSPGQVQRLLRMVETQERPASGDVRREPREIPGVGVGVFVGDLFVHNLNVVARTQPSCPAGTTPKSLPRSPSARYPVAVQ